MTTTTGGGGLVALSTHDLELLVQAAMTTNMAAMDASRCVAAITVSYGRQEPVELDTDSNACDLRVFVW
jgi:hypothetical protein